jgi:hypothetical protein
MLRGQKGINRFEVQAGDKTAQVMLELELSSVSPAASA